MNRYDNNMRTKSQWFLAQTAVLRSQKALFLTLFMLHFILHAVLLECVKFQILPNERSPYVVLIMDCAHQNHSPAKIYRRENICKVSSFKAR